MNDSSLSGKAILISGGSTGIGRATALLLATQGAKIFTYARNRSQLDTAIEDIKEKSGNRQVYSTVADQSDFEQVKKAFDMADQTIGPVDILINNAAIGGGSITNLNYSDWEYLINTNVLGYMACTQQALKRMLPKKQGHIINIGSMSANTREGGSSVYNASKSAIQSFSESIRKELTPKGIKVTLIEPGSVGTDMLSTPPDRQRQLEDQGKMLKSQDIASCVLFTLSQPDRSDVIHISIRPRNQPI